MGALADVFENEKLYTLVLDQMSEAASYLGSFDELSEEMAVEQSRLDTVTGVFHTMVKRAPNIKTGLRSFQVCDPHSTPILPPFYPHFTPNFTLPGSGRASDQGGDPQVRERMAEYREEFRAMPFFVFETGTAGAYQALKEQDKELKSIQKKLDEHSRLAKLFECLDTIKAPQKVLETPFYPHFTPILPLFCP